MTLAWYIDALDALSGYAFASHRTPDQVEQRLPDDSDTVFIEAPHFVAERVSSRAVALGGTHAQFQEGLYLKGDEVPFPTLDAVCDFVRRAYGSGGGGDDGRGAPNVPEGGGPNNPPPEFPNMEEAREETDWRTVDPVNALSDAMAAFAETSSYLPTYDVNQCVSAIPHLPETLSQPAQAYGTDAMQRLVRAALRLVLAAFQLPDSPNDVDAQWAISRSRQTLYECIKRMGLWQQIEAWLSRDERAFALVVKTIGALSRGPYLIREFDRSLPHRIGLLLAIMLVYGSEIDEGTFDPYDLHEILDYGDVGFRAHQSMEAPLDPFGDVARIVIRPRLLPVTFRFPRGAPTLRNLITLACNATCAIKWDRAEISELLLFAACYLHVQPGLDFWHGAYRSQPSQARGQTAYQLLATRQMIADGMRWIEANFPRYCFCMDLEELIAATASLDRLAQDR
jgi:hypothetical protein